MIHAPIGERGGRQRIAAKKGPSEATQWVEVGLQPTGTTVLALGRFRVSPPFPSSPSGIRVGPAGDSCLAELPSHGASRRGLRRGIFGGMSPVSNGLFNAMPLSIP